VTEVTPEARHQKFTIKTAPTRMAKLEEDPLRPYSTSSRTS